MPLDPSIPLSFKAPEIASPMSTVSQLMQMRGLASQVALRNAQIEQAQEQTKNIAAEAQAKNLDLRDSNFLQQAGLDPEKHARLALGDTSDVSGHVQLKTEQAIQTNALKVQQERATLTKDDLANRNTAAKAIGESVAGLLSMTKADGTPDFDRINASLPSTLTAITPQIKTLGLDPAKFNVQVSSADQLHALAAGMAGETALNDTILAQKKEQAATVASSATARKATADADKQEMMNTMLRNAQQGIQAGQHPIDSILPAAVDAAANSSYKAAYNAALATGGPEAAKSILDAAARHATELSPATRANKAKTAHDEAAATEGVHIDQAIRTEIGKVQAMGSMQLAPAQQAIADRLATGDYNPTLVARRPDGEALIAAAIAKNPNWTQQTYATKKAFEDPQSKQSQNLGTISRIVGHIGRFEQNSKDLGVSPSLLLGVSLTGKAAATQEDAHAISAELEKLVSGGVGTEGQTQSWAKSLTSTSPAIRQQAIDEISQLIGSQYEGMNQTYKTTIGSDLPIEKYVSSNGRAWMTSKGISAGGSAPAGATHATPTISDRAAYDKLPSGAVYIDAGDGQQKRKK